MAIVPPDPGLAIKLAKTCDYDRDRECFVDARGNRAHLYPDGGKFWNATSREERTVSATTYAVLRAADEQKLGLRGTVTPIVEHGTHAFRSGGELYVLEDDGFEARAVPA